jgi:hypothetical protein
MIRATAGQLCSGILISLAYDSLPKLKTPEAKMQSQDNAPKIQPQPVRKPMNTAEFPAGLITDYIKIVDQLRKAKK